MIDNTEDIVSKKGMEASDVPVAVDPTASSEEAVEIYIDPAKEAAALRKFDRWLVPVAFCFLVLSSLDRNNVCHCQLFLSLIQLSLTALCTDNVSHSSETPRRLVLRPTSI